MDFFKQGLSRRLLMAWPIICRHKRGERLGFDPRRVDASPITVGGSIYPCTSLSTLVLHSPTTRWLFRFFFSSRVFLTSITGCQCRDRASPTPSLVVGIFGPVGSAHHLAATTMTSLLPADGSTLAPLPEPLRNSLIAVTTLALLSFVSTTLLVLYITYRLVKWDVAVQQTKRQVIEDAMIRQAEVDGTNDLSLGLEERHYVYLKAKLPSPPNSEPPTPRFEKDRVLEEVKDKRWNPILMLIYNLLCANLIEAMAFLLSGK
jgi:hypothetical protein